MSDSSSGEREELNARERRIGLNEAVFREVNERVAELGAHFQVDPLDIVCECGRPRCTSRIVITRAEYEQLRSDPTHFALVPGHDMPSVEEIVERHPSHDVVRKREGPAAEIAEETDPRSGDEPAAGPSSRPGPAG